MRPWMDAHCHFTPRFFPKPLAPELARLHADGCSGFVLGGVDPLDWQEQLEIPASPLRVIRGFGLHPWTVQERDDSQLDKDFVQLKTMLPMAEALGECGLDYYRCKTEAEREQQIRWFEQQLDLAIAQKKPCIFHIVRAHHEALRIMKKYAGKVHGIVHSFWANAQTAQSWLDLGFHLSVHPRIHKGDTHGLLTYIPADRILFESDEVDLRLALAIMEGVAAVLKTPLDPLIERQSLNLLDIFPSQTP